MQNSIGVLGIVVGVALAGCAATSGSSYPATTPARLATYAKATPCCDDPSGFDFVALPKQGRVDAVIDAKTPVFDFQSGVSPFVAFKLPELGSRYRVRVKSLIDPKAGDASGIFYPVIALLDETYIVVHMSGLENLRLEHSLATVAGKTGIAVSVGIDPDDQKGKYLVVFTPAAMLGQSPAEDREGDVLSLSALAWMERSGESALPASPYGRLQVTIAPEAAVAATAKD